MMSTAAIERIPKMVPDKATLAVREFAATVHSAQSTGVEVDCRPFMYTLASGSRKMAPTIDGTIDWQPLLWQQLLFDIRMTRPCHQKIKVVALCDSCGKARAHQKCGGCHDRLRMRYCGVICQENHWTRSHGADCPRDDKKCRAELDATTQSAIYRQKLSLRPFKCLECWACIARVCQPADGGAA